MNPLELQKRLNCTTNVQNVQNARKCPKCTQNNDNDPKKI